MYVHGALYGAYCAICAYRMVSRDHLDVDAVRHGALDRLLGVGAGGVKEGHDACHVPVALQQLGEQHGIKKVTLQTGRNRGHGVFDTPTTTKGKYCYLIMIRLTSFNVDHLHPRVR